MDINSMETAHPAISQLSCAALHPTLVSCTQAFLRLAASRSRQTLQIVFPVYAMRTLFKTKKHGSSPSRLTKQFIMNTLKTTAFLTLALTTAWSSICFTQKYLPSYLLRHIFRVSGVIGGIFAFIDRANSHPIFVDAGRAAAISWLKAHPKGQKSRLLRFLPSPESIIFVVSIATLNLLYDISPNSITSSGALKLVALLRGAPRLNLATPNHQVAGPSSAKIAENTTQIGVNSMAAIKADVLADT